MSRRGTRIGDAMQIELPDGTFAYGGVLDDAAVALYRTRTDAGGPPPVGSRDYEFVNGVTEQALRKWPVVGRDPGP